MTRTALLTLTFACLFCLGEWLSTAPAYRTELDYAARRGGRTVQVHVPAGVRATQRPSTPLALAFALTGTALAGTSLYALGLWLGMGRKHGCRWHLRRAYRAFWHSLERGLESAVSACVAPAALAVRCLAALLTSALGLALTASLVVLLCLTPLTALVGLSLLALASLGVLAYRLRAEIAEASGFALALCVAALYEARESAKEPGTLDTLAGVGVGAGCTLCVVLTCVLVSVLPEALFPALTLAALVLVPVALTVRHAGGAVEAVLAWDPLAVETAEATEVAGGEATGTMSVAASEPEAPADLGMDAFSSDRAVYLPLTQAPATDFAALTGDELDALADLVEAELAVRYDRQRAACRAFDEAGHEARRLAYRHAMAAVTCYTLAGSLGLLRGGRCRTKLVGASVGESQAA